VLLWRNPLGNEGVSFCIEEEVMLETKLYKYQRHGVKLISHFEGRALLADEMGLGKTIQSLAWLWQQQAFPVVVVCPASLKWNWEHEARQHLGLRAMVLEGTKVPRQRLIRSRMVILNYDILKPWMDYLKWLEPQLLIFDEAHYVKNRTTQRAKLLKKLAKSIPNVIGMSGTPLTNRPAELWNVVDTIRPDLYPSFVKFAFRYCQPRRTPWGWDYRGAARLEELHGILDDHMMIRRLKKDVLKDLPSKTRSVVLLEMERKSEYDHARNDFIGWLRKNVSKGKADRAARAERLMRLGYLKRLSAELKLSSVLEWITTFLEGSDEKLVVFAVHHKVIDALQERFGRQCVVVTGETSQRDRKRAVEMFQTSPKTRLFLGNIQAAGVGLNLVAASTVAFVELSWSPGEHGQAEDRIHRIGQVSNSMVYYLVARGSIEEDLCKVIQKKQEVLNKVLDGDGTATEMDIFSQVEQALLQGGKS